MKLKLYIAGLFLVFGMNVHAGGLKPAQQNTPQEKDSIIVTFGDRTRLIIYGEDRKELEKIMKYDLNTLLKDLKIRLDSTDADTTYLREEINGSKYLKDKSNDEDYVRIGLRGIHIKNGDTEVKINAKGVEVEDEDDDNGKSDSNYRRTGKRFYRSGGGSSPRKGFNIALGLNTYGTNETTPGFSKDDYDLKPFGSRYISLGYIASTTIAKGKNARLHLDFGVDFSWYNLMFDGNNTVAKDSLQISFPLVTNENGEEIEMKKSKLTVPYVNISFMPTLSFSRSFISYISAGVYGGYRLGSYTKLRREGSKDVDHVRKNFYIEDLRYGLSAELGIRNFPDFFVNYDFNNLYQDGKGPSVRMLSFGVRLF
ncbi:outer membrane beta-barrel protein [Dyadobacter sp. CY327]|uniref:outer membrane beta-barrel protein n=1 Tax=Dyadobacter sp. CY327 TaxID=2907301 RepID=UPI001F22B0B4|nr:outer membrane beta-barrel protein [Dyadobacter sp. CY327]MCE7073369.1 outer membrane beta-barrel protein [Dyadobacter sp. CY327]